MVTCLWSMIINENEMKNIIILIIVVVLIVLYYLVKSLVIVGLLTVTGVWLYFWIPKKMKKLNENKKLNE